MEVIFKLTAVTVYRVRGFKLWLEGFGACSFNRSTFDQQRREAEAFRTEFEDVHWPRKGNFMRLLVHFLKKKKKQSKTKESLGMTIMT